MVEELRQGMRVGMVESSMCVTDCQGIMKAGDASQSAVSEGAGSGPNCKNGLAIQHSCRLWLLSAVHKCSEQMPRAPAVAAHHLPALPCHRPCYNVILPPALQGSGTQEFTKLMQQYFTKVVRLRVEASRSMSREFYAIGLGRKQPKKK
jgi:hypothetical protein